MGMRIAVIGQDEFQKALFTGDSWIEMPDDAKIVDVRLNFSTQCVEVLCESPAWEPVPEGCHIPCFDWRLGLRALSEALSAAVSEASNG